MLVTKAGRAPAVSRATQAASTTPGPGVVVRMRWSESASGELTGRRARYASEA